MAEASERLARRVHADFSADDATRVLESLRTIPEALPLADKQSAERLQTAAVLRARGDYARFGAAMAVARRDWRDLLMGAGLAHGDWPERLDEALGP